MVLYAVRFLFAVLVLALTWTYINKTGMQSGWTALWLVSGGIVLAVVVLLIEWLMPRKGLRALGGLFFGLIVGMVIGYALSLVIDLIALTMMPGDWPSQPTRDIFINTFKMLIGLIACYFCISFVLQTKDDIRFIIPYVEFSKQSKGTRPILLDTSTIIDGRIADVCNTGILNAPMIVPRFVLLELQRIADSSDRLKRNRGRRGLDVLNQLQRNDKVDVDIIEPRWTHREPAEDVDQKLIAMAAELDARIITSDFNLSKVAQLRGIEVINLNDVSNALKPIVLPGETLVVKVIRPGEEQTQGVGYLDDGTMVVIEGGRERIGQEVSIVVTSGLQTSAGRMLFGRVDGAGSPAGTSQTRPKPKRFEPGRTTPAGNTRDAQVPPPQNPADNGNG